MARWAKLRPQKAAPPLKTLNGLVSDPSERARLLRDLLLSRYSSENDVNFDQHAPTEGNLPWTFSVSDEEVKWVTIICQNKSPGADAITVRLPKAAWPSISHAVRVLYEVSLQLKHFPKAFKLAEVILLQKPGRDLS